MRVPVIGQLSQPGPEFFSGHPGQLPGVGLLHELGVRSIQRAGLLAEVGQLARHFVQELVALG